jgi:hypothetical protein
MNQSQKKLNIRERIFKWIFITGDRYKQIVSLFNGFCGFINTVTLSLFILGLIFSTSFMVIILLGSGLLMLQRVHTGHLSWLDSLFTSVSAVCVTGLVVVDAISISDRFNLKLVAIKIAPKEGLLISIFRRFFKVDMSYDPYSPLGEKDVLVLAGKIADIKRFVES